MLDSFTVENYRAFAKAQKIDVRPLTLFFGWNSGGKSSLLRFLPLLAESIRADGPPIWLGGELGRGATWSDLVCKAAERQSLRFALEWSGDYSMRAQWDIAGDGEGRWQETQELSVSLDEGPHKSYLRDENLMLRWLGLLPELGGEISTLKDVLHKLSREVQWISGVRVSPPRIATFSGGVPTVLKGDGRDAMLHLIAAHLKSTAAPLLELTGEFFLNLGDVLVLDNPAIGVWQTMLQPTNASQVRVNICDTGEGYAQVLPVLVALARARLDGPKLLCLEQPELHLHTRAQLELSRALIETAKSERNPKILVETHSEILLMSVQLAIAEGRIPPEDVRVYWVESRLDGTSEAVAVDFSETGQPIGTELQNAFGEAISLGRDLVLKQLNHGAK